MIGLRGEYTRDGEGLDWGCVRKNVARVVGNDREAKDGAARIGFGVEEWHEKHAWEVLRAIKNKR